MEAFQTAAIAGLGGIVALVFAVGAVKVGIPAAKYTVNVVSGLFSR